MTPSADEFDPRFLPRVLAALGAAALFIVVPACGSDSTGDGECLAEGASCLEGGNCCGGLVTAHRSTVDSSSGEVTSTCTCESSDGTDTGPHCARDCTGCGSEPEEWRTKCTEVPSIWDPLWTGRASLRSIWASSLSDIYAAGQKDDDPDNDLEGPIILHFDGQSWTEADLSRAGDYEVVALSGSSFDNVVALQTYPLRYDGASWNPMSTVGISGAGTGMDIWAFGPDDVSYVEAGGAVFHYDGQGWSIQRQGSAQGNRGPLPLGLWGSAPNDMFLVAREGTIYHYDGNAWSSQDSQVTTNLKVIWGSGPDDVYVIGEFGDAFLHYDGSTWSPVDFPLGRGHSIIWGRGGSDVFVYGGAPENDWTPSGDGCVPRGVDILSHFDGQTWSCIWAPTNDIVTEMWGTETDVYGVGVRANEAAVFHLSP